MLRGFFTNSVGTLVSRVLGFVRDLLTASVLGAGIYSDLFFVTFKLPQKREGVLELALDRQLARLTREDAKRPAPVSKRQRVRAADFTCIHSFSFALSRASMLSPRDSSF